MNQAASGRPSTVDHSIRQSGDDREEGQEQAEGDHVADGERADALEHLAQRDVRSGVGSGLALPH